MVTAQNFLAFYGFKCHDLHTEVYEDLSLSKDVTGAHTHRQKLTTSNFLKQQEVLKRTRYVSYSSSPSIGTDNQELEVSSSVHYFRYCNFSLSFKVHLARFTLSPYLYFLKGKNFCWSLLCCLSVLNYICVIWMAH